MSCKKCGACCKYVVIPHPGHLSYDAKEWSDAHGHRRMEYPDITLVFVPNRCKHLKEDNTCAIYEVRPGVCRAMPTRELKRFHPPECEFFNEEKSE